MPVITDDHRHNHDCRGHSESLSCSSTVTVQVLDPAASSSIQLESAERSVRINQAGLPGSPGPAPVQRLRRRRRGGGGYGDSVGHDPSQSRSPSLSQLFPPELNEPAARQAAATEARVTPAGAGGRRASAVRTGRRDTD